MRKILALCLLLMLLMSTSAIAEQEAFDPSVLEIYDGYTFDKFDKEWTYFECYRNTYNDAYVDIGFQADAYNEGLKILLFARILDLQQRQLYTVDSIDFLIDDITYSFELRYIEGNSNSYIYLGREKMVLLEALAGADEISIRLSHDGGNTVEELTAEDHQSTLKEAAQVILFHNLMDYVGDWSQEWDETYPLLLDGKPVGAN